MIVIPAIDIKDGKCVRLYQGDMESSKIYADNPEEAATRWEDAGARLIHLVDLDGAVAGEPRNLGSIARILETISVPIELGGGIRSREIVEDYLQLGVSRIVLGTSACKDPDLTGQLCTDFPGQIVVGIDARGGFVAVQGWQEVTEKRAIDLAEDLQSAGVSYIIYTDIERDGALSGPNLESTAELARGIDIPVVLSGGMHSHEDIEKVAELEELGVGGVILGRSLYEGTIDLQKAIEDHQREGDTL